MTSLINAVVVMLIIGALLGLLLGVAGKFLSVPVDPRIETVAGMLPNYNCGGCGYAGCSAMAEAIVNGEVKKVSQCKPSKDEARQKIITYLAETPGPDGNTITVTL